MRSSPASHLPLSPPPLPRFRHWAAPPARRPRNRQQPAVERSASGTVIQPTTTIIPDGNGHRTIIIIPRHRSYLDTGTEVSVGDRDYRDYMLPPGGDPGRPNWFMGPDLQGDGGYPLSAPVLYSGTQSKHAVLT